MAKKGAKNSKRTTKSTPSSITDGPTLGISKLKSQLRQAKRLLLKDGLSPELRSTTEQRISQLEASITHVPSKEQERRNAIKYRRIKFFDRKKVARRLKKVLNELDQLNSAESTPPEANKHKLELEAQHLRIDLNYVRHYPKHLKYVSLCPGGQYKDHEATMSSLPETEPSSKDPDLLRNYVRNFIRRSMESGTLSNTPEADEPDKAEDVEPSNVAADDDDFFEHDAD